MKNKLVKYKISVALCLCTSLFSGCIHFYDYKHYPVQVIDPELNRPVENALITVSYPGIGVAEIRGNKPIGINTRTDVNGYATIKVAKPGPRLNIVADGYLSISETYPFFYSRIPKVFRIGNEGQVIIPLYREPEPKLKIIIPNDYQGPVALHFFQIKGWIQGKPEQRQFSYEVGQNGYLPIKASPLLSSFILKLDYENPGINVRYENGKEILYAGREHGLEPDEIAFRRVYSEGPKFLYIVGTEHDRDVLHKKVYPENHIDREVFNSYFQEPVKQRN